MPAAHFNPPVEVVHGTGGQRKLAVRRHLGIQATPTSSARSARR
jgi:hypothetical protein